LFRTEISPSMTMWHHRFNTLVQNPCKFYLPPTLSFTMETTQWTKHVHLSLFAKLKSLCLHHMLSKHQLVQVFSFIINWYASKQVEFLKWTLMMSVLFIFNDLEYELITCVRQANENATNLIPVVQFLIHFSQLRFDSLFTLSWSTSSCFFSQPDNTAQRCQNRMTMAKRVSKKKFANVLDFSTNTFQTH